MLVAFEILLHTLLMKERQICIRNYKLQSQGEGESMFKEAISKYSRRGDKTSRWLEPLLSQSLVAVRREYFEEKIRRMKCFLTSLLLLANFRNELKNVPKPLYLIANDFWLRKCDPPFGQ